MADKKFTQLTAAGVLAAADLLAISQSPFGAGTSRSITGTDLLTFVGTTFFPLSGLGAGVATFLATPTSANLAAAVTNETGTGALVFATSPTLVTPLLGTPTSGVLTNCTGLPIASGVSGLAAGVATFLATPSSANLIAAVTDETGTGALVFATSPTLVTPLLGTPTSGVLTNCTGLPVASGISGLAAGVATFLATPSSANLIAAVTDETGTGALVFATSPTLVTPLLGTPTSGVLTNCTGLPVASGISGLAAGVATFLATPSSANLIAAVTDETGTGALVFATSPTLVTPLLGTPTSGVLTSCTGLPISTGVSGLAANVATFLATPSSANLIAAVTDETGTGALMFGTSPSITTDATLTRTALGSTPADGFIITNTTAAAVGAQQFSPAIRLTGQGWGTTAGTSQSCDWRIYNTPVQSTVPTSTLLFQSSIAGSAYATRCSMNSAGALGGMASIDLTSGSLITFSASGIISWSARSRITSAADGRLLLQNSALTDFNRLQFGGTTSSFPALNRAAAVLEVKLADDSAYSQLYAATLRTSQTTVANLPAAATAAAGARAFVTDALAPAFGVAVAGAGAVSVPVYSDGAAWLVG